MKMKRRTLLILPLVGIAGIALGVYLGRGPLAPSSPAAEGPNAVLIPGSILQGAPIAGGASGSGEAGRGSLTGGGAAGSGSKQSPIANALLGVINNPNGQSAVNQFYQLLGRMPSKDIADLIVDIDGYPNHSRRRETREMIIDYLAMADPMKALEVHQQLPTLGIFNKAFRQLGRTDPEQALRLHDGIADASEKSNAMTAIFVGTSEVDPLRAFQLLQKTEGVGPQHYHEVFDNWAEMDPTTAAKMALTVTKSAERREALKIVGQEWAERDPQAVLDWIEETKLTSYERESMRNSALSAYARRDATAAMDLLAGLDPSIRNRALPDALNQLIQQDTDAAIAWIREEPDGFSKFRALDSSAYNLARKAPDATIELAKEIPELADNALGYAFGALASNDTHQALEKAKEWRDHPQYANIISQIASGYARKDPEEALQWANGLDDSVRSSAISSALGQFSGSEPTLAIKQLDDLGMAQNDPVYHNAIQNIVSNWASQDPVSAAEWIDTLSEPDLHMQAVSDVADRWARIDPVSASEWISTMEAGAARDQAANRLVNRIQRDDPEMAAAWASSIGDENLRNNALSNVFSQWMRLDSGGAQAALEASMLPEPMKENYRRRFDSAGP